MFNHDCQITNKQLGKQIRKWKCPLYVKTLETKGFTCKGTHEEKILNENSRYPTLQILNTEFYPVRIIPKSKCIPRDFNQSLVGQSLCYCCEMVKNKNWENSSNSESSEFSKT
uniref:Uncharacterized protein n=1 Tax=Cacopsylla melanoneura TaxID=428564 RepID=A0A8D9BE29_9HEMI